MHHVRPRPDQILYDISYDAFALLLLGMGWFLLHQSRVR
ncbi:DUF2243 domain-containing protein [Paenibacillus sp. OAS669]